MKNQQEKTVLSADQRRELKKLAHHLKPVVIIGKKGLSDPVIKEIDLALLAHELIKIQVHPSHKATLMNDVGRIVQETSSSYIDTIGNIVILYRERLAED
jgi:RNA-binding protein